MKSLTLFSVFLLTSFALLGQTHTLELDLDFKTKEFKGLDALDNLREGGYYRLKISSINSNLYKISIGKVDSSVSTPLTVPGFGSFGVDVLEKLVGGLSPLGGLTIPSTFLSMDEKENLIDKSFDLLTLHEKNFDQKIKEHIKVLDPKITPTDADAAKALIEGYQEVLKKQLLKLTGTKLKIDDLIFTYNKFLIKAQFEFGTVDSEFNTNNLSVAKLYKEFQDFRSELVALDNDLKKEFENYLEKAKKYEKIIKENEILKKEDESIKASYQEFVSTLAKAKESISAENTIKYVATVVAVINNDGLNYISLPLQFSQELAVLKIDIVPRDDKALLQAYHAEFSFPIDKRDKFWGVSSGFYLSSLHDEAYSTISSYDPSLDTTSYSLAKEKPGNAEFGLNAMIRHGWRINKEVFFQMGFGPAISLSEKVKPRVLTGFGLGFGEKHKFLFDVGIAVGYSNVLSSGYSSTQMYGIKPEGVVVSQLKCGGYFSIGYLFFK